MKTVGIIAEYNPFHNGHAYHIAKAKALTGASCAVIVMNGDFVQRGEPAFVSKYTRTQMALAGGGDMIFQLPITYGISSGEDFAMGSVSLLEQLGFVDCICFGSEDGRMESLIPYGDFFAQESEEYKELLGKYCREGIGYPAARQLATEALLDTSALADLTSPNNLLGIEYLKALRRLDSSMVPYTIQREGHGYHETDSLPGKYPSATALRRSYQEGHALSQGIPEQCQGFINDALSHYQPITLQDFSEQIYYSILEHTGQLHEFKDVTPDLADRIENLLPDYRDVESFSSLLQSKQYTTGRIHRCLCQILLGIKKLPDGKLPLRLLGLNKEFSYLLKGRDDIIVKPAREKEALQQDFFASHLYEHAVHRQSGYHIGNECTHSPILI